MNAIGYPSASHGRPQAEAVALAHAQAPLAAQAQRAAFNSCPQCHSPRRPHRVCPHVRLLRRAVRSSRPSRTTTTITTTSHGRRSGRHRRGRLRNGADLGPAEVAAGAAIAAAQGVRVLLFGPRRRDRRRRRRRRGRRRAGVDRQGRRSRRAPSARRPRPRSCRRRGPSPRGARRRSSRGGSTGAALAAGLFNIKRARGIYRPALAIPLPVPGKPVTLLDVGANAESRAASTSCSSRSWARRSAQAVLGVERPRVGAAVQRRGGDARARRWCSRRTRSCRRVAGAASSSSATSRASTSPPASPT